MARVAKPLSNTQIDKAKSKVKPYKLNDGNGLYLLVSANGNKFWKVDYKSPVTAKRKTYSLGRYPDLSLAEARLQCTEVRKLVAKDIDPVEHKKALAAEKASQQIPFRQVADDWLADREKENKQDKENIRRLDSNIKPAIGDIPYTQVTKDIMQEKVLDPIIERGAYHEAKRNKSILKLIFDYAIEKYEVLTENPAIKLKHPVPEEGHFDALSEEHEFRQFVQDAWGYKDKFPRANIHTACLLKLSVLIFLRPAEIRGLKWEQYNKSENLLELYISKVKIKHIVPLAPQAQAIMDVLEANRICNTYVFPTHWSGKTQPLSEGVIRTALAKLGYKGKQTAHGLRASARTLLDEELEQNVEYIENQITHKHKDSHNGAYNRSKYLKQRKRILALWADYVEALVNGEDVSRFKKDDENSADPMVLLSQLMSDGKYTKEELLERINNI